jgi:hypothetical protein
MRPCVFVPCLVLAIFAGQVIAFFGSRYLACVDVYGPQLCAEYITERLPRRKP